MTLDDESLNGNALINGSNNDVAMKNSFRLVILGKQKKEKNIKRQKNNCLLNVFFFK